MPDRHYGVFADTSHKRVDVTLPRDRAPRHTIYLCVFGLFHDLMSSSTSISATASAGGIAFKPTHHNRPDRLFPQRRGVEIRSVMLLFRSRCSFLHVISPVSVTISLKKKENHSAEAGCDSCVQVLGLFFSPVHHTSEHHQADSDQRERSQFRNRAGRCHLIRIESA